MCVFFCLVGSFDLLSIRLALIVFDTVVLFHSLFVLVLRSLDPLSARSPLFILRPSVLFDIWWYSKCYLYLMYICASQRNWLCNTLTYLQPITLRRYWIKLTQYTPVAYIFTRFMQPGLWRYVNVCRDFGHDGVAKFRCRIWYEPNTLRGIFGAMDFSFFVMRIYLSLCSISKQNQIFNAPDEK